MKGLHKLTASGLALLLAASFVVFSWSAPQAHFHRRNWTPQAMLYLKGAQGRRFMPEESQRKDLYDRLQLETRSQNTDPLSLSEAAALLLSSLQKAKEAEEETSDHPGYLADNLSNWFPLGSTVKVPPKVTSSYLLKNRLSQLLEMSFLEQHKKFLMAPSKTKEESSS